MKIKLRKTWILFLVIFYIVLFSNIIFSNPSNPFKTSKTCSDTWGGDYVGGCNNFTINDASLGCNGTQVPPGNNPRIKEVYINASSFFYGDGINATCEVMQLGGYTNFIYLWYYNTTNWINIQNWSSQASPSGKNYSSIFNVNSTEGTHIVRCIISWNYTAPSDGQIPNECANSTYSNYYDNDDVNFTVTSHLTYNFWNLTNYTTGENISSGQTYNRTDSFGNITYINVSTHWNKNISYAAIEINGTGTWVNYTICTYPNCTDNWTNYTINLSDATKYNQYNITINTIYVNDTTSATNNTSPLLFFYLNIGSEPPNISSYWFQPLTNRTNLYTNLTIYANVSDDSGISTVRANLTYPDNTSVILNLTGDPNPGNRTWNYTFRTTGFTLNETGNYTVWWVSVKDNGNQEVNLTQNLTFYVTNNLTVNISVSSSTPGKGTPINPVSISIFDVSNNYHQFLVNLTVRCLNISYVDTNFSLANVNGQTTFTDCYAPNSYSTSFNITVNASDAYNNTGDRTLTITTESAPSGGGTSGGGGGGGGNITIIQNVTVNTTVKTTDFNFTAQTTGIQVYRGEDATIVGSVSNSGNTNLTISSSIFLNSTCCIVSIVPSEFKLNVGKAELPFTVSIHVNTSTEPDKEYFFDIKIKAGTLEKTKRIKIIVKENPVISSLQQVSGQVSGIEDKLKEYARVGLNIGDLEGLLNKIKETLAGSQSHIEKDDINTLKSNENSVKLSLAQINDQLNKLAFVKTIYENKWNIISGITIGIISTYLVVLVFVPYFKLGPEIRKLKFEKESLIKSRVETEKSYFLRRMDEKTFRNIISLKQSQILKTTADIKLKEQARSQLFREKINPLYVGKLIKEKIKKKNLNQTNNAKTL
jgi:hypothetical protein